MKRKIDQVQESKNNKRRKASYGRVPGWQVLQFLEQYFDKVIPCEKVKDEINDPILQIMWDTQGIIQRQADVPPAPNPLPPGAPQRAIDTFQHMNFYYGVHLRPVLTRNGIINYLYNLIRQ